MVKWWSRRFYAEKKMTKDRRTALIENQRNSLLQEFMDYENHPQDNRQMQLEVFISKDGRFIFSVEFNGERTRQFPLSGDVPYLLQENPELFIEALYDEEEYNERSHEFYRFMETEKELKELLKRIVDGRDKQQNLVVLLADRASGRVLKDLDEYEQLALDVFDMLESKKTMLHESPFFAERLYATYRAFLAQRTVRDTLKPADPVEEDLVRILENEKLSEQTKEKARSLLDAYREQKHEKDGEDIDGDEQEANLILSTIEQHYVKGGSR